MPTHDIVVIASLLAGAACLLVFVLGALASIRAQAAQNQRALNGDRAITVDDIGKVIEALAKLTDSLAKAGPTISALIGAIGFFSIAALMVK
jgi:hypothetical protein